ncbi:TetR/AcrR family transcriptional regulator [Granulicella sp. dw_53]|uniref:TetR/AcrR family transcriptional regulator n=1 Tax=Granulicella sp. dw_53 TaxID=2719792 RepID=UPI001BD479F2|nr:TetR/AcrR family transcriptional regulator [Granulicella sp. dw_53]
MPISDCDVRDPRIRRTRQLLQGALKQLMEKKGFDEVSVQDITEAATVNRATFYDHYTDKFALLDAMVGGGFHKLLHERAVRFDGSCPSAASAVILATCDYLTQMETGDGTCQRQSAFQPLVDAAITRAIGRVLSDGFAGSEDGLKGKPDGKIIAAAASWAIYGAVKEWFGSVNRVPAEEMVEMVLELVLPVLSARVGSSAVALSS